MRKPPDAARAREPETLTVGRAAELVGVSVRTLHHWDEIGLVRPSGRSAAGYRLYGADDIARIHRVLVYRALDLPLAEVARLLDDPSLDAAQHLRRQREQLAERIARLTRTAAAVDAMIATMSAAEGTAGTEGTEGIKGTRMPLSPAQQAEIFGTDWGPEYREEARDRWGDTEQWRQAEVRTASWGVAEWRAVKDEVDALDADLADAFERGVVPGSTEADALAERHRAAVARHYDCSHAQHVLIARTYTEGVGPGAGAPPAGGSPGATPAGGNAGASPATRSASNPADLAAWLREVIEANARAHGVDPATATWEDPPGMMDA